VKQWKLLAYHLKDLRVPPVVRVPQVGTPVLNKSAVLRACRSMMANLL